MLPPPLPSSRIFPCCPWPCIQRVIYAESAGQGLAVNEVDAKGEAAREIARLVGHLFTKEEKKVA